MMPSQSLIGFHKPLYYFLQLLSAARAVFQAPIPPSAQAICRVKTSQQISRATIHQFCLNQKIDSMLKRSNMFLQLFLDSLTQNLICSGAKSRVELLHYAALNNGMGM
jgi:hypothetical protein